MKIDRIMATDAPDFMDTYLTRSPVNLSDRDPELPSGNPVRDFVFIEDVIDAYLKTASASNLTGQIFNIGSDKKYFVEKELIL